MAPQLLIRNLDADISTRGQKDSTPKLYHRNSGMDTKSTRDDGGFYLVRAPHTEDVTTSSLVRLGIFTPAQRKIK